MADRNQFWQNVTHIDSPVKLAALSAEDLQNYETYFIEVQYQGDLPDWEKLAGWDRGGQI